MVDDLLIGIGHKEDNRRKVSDSEVITTAIIAALYFEGHQDNARGFMQMTGMCPQMLNKSLFCRRLHQLEPLLCSLFFQIGQYMKQISGAGSYVIDSFPVAVCDNIRMLQVAPESSIYRDAAYTDYKMEDDMMEAENVHLKICRKSNSKRKDEPWTGFLNEYDRKRIEIATWVN